MNINYKKIITIIITLIGVSLLITECILNFGKTQKVDINKLEEAFEIVEKHITKYEMSQEQISNLPTKEIIEQNIEDEKQKEQEINEEVEGFQLQGDIAYEGAKAETWNVELGDYIGLTYYSQIDPRWSSHLYTSIGDPTQTIGSSGCGPTCASMVVTGIKGAITPDVMGDLFVKYGYRSSNNGTYFSAFRAVADEFNIGYEESYDLERAIELLKNNNYVVCSVGNGLFTTGGHFILLVGIDGDKIKIYDPYLYSGKFDTSTRRGKVVVDAYNVYCSIDNFRNYANYTKFFAYKHSNDINPNVQPVSTQPYTRYVTAKIGLNIRQSPNGKIIGSYSYGSQVIVYETNGDWSRTDRGWVSSIYLSSSLNASQSLNNSNQYNSKYTVGKYKVTASVLNVRFGAGTNYKAKTWKQLTANARSQNSRLGNYYTNGLKRGVVTYVYEIKNGFGRTNSGWISLAYCTKI